jgi:hypothetical protein
LKPPMPGTLTSILLMAPSSLSVKG